MADTESEKEKVKDFKRRILKTSEIIPFSHLGHLSLGRMFYRFKHYEDAEVYLNGRFLSISEQQRRTGFYRRFFALQEKYPIR